ncbi:MAG: hypothetical protein KIT80_13825 [Chitinophagaceae bacterium]|nr:hypothetical protein [Chitinophagaceae bacterium]MCW5927989.1 hypothetical protein [Chitinophagaceae bacterium]
MKHLFLLLVCLSSHFAPKAQTVFHGIGPNLMVAPETDGMLRHGNYYVGLGYTPRVNLFQQTDISVSLGMPINLNALIDPGILFDESLENMLILISVPAVVNYNWGAGATKDSDKRLGLFVGGGAGYLYRNTAEWYEFTRVNTVAATINAGLRFGVGRYRNKNVELKFNYTVPFQRASQGLFGISALFSKWKP